MSDFLNELASELQKAIVEEQFQQIEWATEVRKLRDYVNEVSDTPIEITDNGDNVELFFTEIEIEIDGTPQDWFRFREIDAAMKFVQQHAPKTQF